MVTMTLCDSGAIERALVRRQELRAEITPLRTGPLAGLWALEIDSREIIRKWG